MYQVDLFSGLYSSFKFDTNKPIKLFEAFAGYGSQYMALKRLGIDIDHQGMSDWWITANIAYHALHNKNTVSYDFIQDKNTLINILMKYGLSSDDKIPVKRNYYERKKIEWLNELHKILIENKNPGAIGSFDRLPKGIDVCTWSFPCQDISLAGNQKGMNDGTKSNYGYIFLDTVEATPYHERPKVLLMENVRALFSAKFRDDWREIQLRLERMGYTNHADVLNAKDYGVAQNRERVFIVSILGEYNYTFPKPIPLTKRLKDYLEVEVDDKYYLSDKMIKYISQAGTKKFKVDTKINLDVARPLTTEHSKRAGATNYISPGLPENFDLKVVGNTNPSGRGMNGNVYDSNGLAPTLTTNKGEGPKIIFSDKMSSIICINSKVDGKQPSLQDRIYDSRGISTAITTSYHPNVLIIPEKTKKGYTLAEAGDGVYINRPHQKRGVVQKGMIQTIKTSVDDMGVVVDNPLRIRKLTPREALRLMDVSESDIDIITSTVSNALAYKLAGNSIVVSVLEAIFKELLIK